MKLSMLLPLIFAMVSSVADAEIYTWTDEHGTVTYTDNPARIPSRDSGRTQVGEKSIIRSPKIQQEVKKHGKKWSQAVIPGNRAKSVAAAIEHQKAVSLEMQAELSGAQKDSAHEAAKSKSNR